MADSGVWAADPSANHLNKSYVTDFMDISGSGLVIRENLIMGTGSMELNGTTTLTQPIFNIDMSLNNGLTVSGNVSIGDASVNIIGDISINGILSVGSYKIGSIDVSAVAMSLTEGESGSGDYKINANDTIFHVDVSYENNMLISGDISMNNGIAYFGPSTTLTLTNMTNGIIFNDDTSINSSNISSGSFATGNVVFKDSSFNNMTVTGGFYSPSAVATTSDYRIKTNVQGLDKTHIVDHLRPVLYYQTQLGRDDIGFLAHEIQEHYPELVNGEKDGSQMQSVNYSGLLPILIHEVQEIKKRIAEKKALI